MEISMNFNNDEKYVSEHFVRIYESLGLDVAQVLIERKVMSRGYEVRTVLKNELSENFYRDGSLNTALECMMTDIENSPFLSTVIKKKDDKIQQLEQDLEELKQRVMDVALKVEE